MAQSKRPLLPTLSPQAPRQAGGGRVRGSLCLFAIGFFILGAAGAAMAQVTDQQATVLHLSQTAERSVFSTVRAPRFGVN